jgi:hypothetical protein
MSFIPDNIDRANPLIREDRRISVLEVAEMLDIGLVLPMQYCTKF